MPSHRQGLSTRVLTAVSVPALTIALTASFVACGSNDQPVRAAGSGAGRLPTPTTITAPADAVPDTGPFDPKLAALGVDTPNDFDTLRAGEQRLAELLDHRSAGWEAARVIDTRWAAAEDDLYSTVARLPGAAKGRAEWAACIHDGGFDADTPEAAEAQVEAMVATDPRRAELITLRESCERQLAERLDALEREAFPAWFEAHKATVAAYKTLVGL